MEISSGVARNCQEKVENNWQLPNGFSRLESQVAGHVLDPSKNSFGMLRGSDGRVYKTSEKTDLLAREIAFYEKINSSEDPIYKKLANLTPKFYGTTEIEINNQRKRFIILEDVTKGMIEPCIMDIKIGKITWDPFASAEKRKSMSQKYVKSKAAFSISIPGFQVYDVETGELKKFDKKYGKSLDEKLLPEAVGIFLNVTKTRPACRQLVISMLATLWKILSLFRTQKILKFYSTSVLLCYDAHPLRELLQKQRLLVTKSGNGADIDFKAGNNRKLCRTHSYENDYDNDIIQMQKDYTSLLKQLNDDNFNETKQFIHVNMIDFGHVFEIHDNSLDHNYLQGIENLIKILERFLANR